MTGRSLVLVLSATLSWSSIAPGEAIEPAPSDPGRVTTADFRDTVRRAKDRVFPAVVFVHCIRDNYDSGKKQAEIVSGSGVLISPTGELLTNWHVVDKAVTIRCLLTGGDSYEARVVGTDKDTDLALLQLRLTQGHDRTPYATIGDSTCLEEGDFVMAMGAPWGLSRSVSIGIVSCTRRYLSGNSEYSLWLQTDCAISPGSSGGPLVNTEGEIVGINSRGFLMGGDVAFAVPSETAVTITDRLREHGRAEWSWTGIQLQPLRDFNRDIYFAGTNGVIVAGTDRESPARLAGLLPRDRILSVGGTEIAAVTEEGLPAVRMLLGRLPVDESIDIRLLRDGQEMTLPIVPRQKGSVEGEEYDCKRWDMAVKSINKFDNPSLYFHRTEGIYVHSVRSPGNAESSGLSTQDIIIKIDGKEVRTIEDVAAIHAESLASIGKKHKVVITLLRNGLLRQVVLDFLRDYEKN